MTVQIQGDDEIWERIAVAGVHKTVGELADLTLSRGLEGVTREYLEKWFKNHNYYRFLGYAKAFMKDPVYGDKTFLPGTDFATIEDLIESDSVLRAMLLSLIFPVERTLRTSYARIAYEVLERKGDPYRDNAFYMEPNRYRQVQVNGSNEAERLSSGIMSDLSKSRDPNVVKFINKDEPIEYLRYEKVPIWAAVEAMSFGRVSRMLELASDQDIARGVAADYSLQWDRFCSDVHAICDLRNRCAHHDKLWNTECVSSVRKYERYTKLSPWKPMAGSVQLSIMTIFQFRSRMGLPTAERQQVEDLLRRSEIYRAGILNPRWTPDTPHEEVHTKAL